MLVVEDVNWKIINEYNIKDTLLHFEIIVLF